MKIHEVNGYKFFCRDFPRYDDEFCVNEVVEGDIYRIQDWKFQGGTIVDIGANIGAFAIPASKYGKVLAYEPSEENFKLLKMNIALNNANVEAFNCAVGKPGLDTIENDNSGHSRLGSAGGEGNQLVKVIGFDEICERIDKLDNNTILMVKSDAEGAEYDIFKYASIENLKKVQGICGELHSWLFENKEFAQKHKEMIDKLESVFDIKYEGYKDSAFLGVNKNGDKRTKNE